MSQGVGELAAVAATGVWKRGDVETNSVLAYRAEAMLIDKQLTVTGSYGSSSWRRDDGSQQTSDSSSRHRGDLGKVAVDWRDGRLSLGTGWSFVSPDFRAANGFIEFPGRRGLELRAEYGDQWRDRYVRGAWAGLWAGYEERYDTGAGHEDLDGLVDRAFSTLGDRDTNDRFFNDSVGYWMHIDTRSNLAFHHRTRWGHWREEGARTSDADRSTLFSFRMESEDHSRDGWVRYSFGREDDADRHFTSVGASWKREQFAVQYSGSVLRHRERRQQHILGVNYDLTTSMTVGGRLVFHRDERADDNTWNPYVAFRRSGETGIETFLILGDPSGDEFVRRVEGKILLPL